MMHIVIGYSQKAPKNSVCTAKEKEKCLSTISQAIKTHTNVEVIKLNGVDEVLWVRDLFFILEGKCIICNCTKNDSIMKDRSIETDAILPLIKSMEYPIIWPPDSVLLEGGDVIQNGNDLFVGINKRTNYDAVKFLSETFKVNVIPVRHNDMHLDCVFTVVKNRIFYSKRRVNEIDLRAVIGYDIVDIDDETDGILSTNILIIDEHIFHSDRVENTTITKHLEDMGLNVHKLEYGQLWKEGGGIRCLTQVL